MPPPPAEKAAGGVAAPATSELGPTPGLLAPATSLLLPGVLTSATELLLPGEPLPPPPLTEVPATPTLVPRPPVVVVDVLFVVLVIDDWTACGPGLPVPPVVEEVDDEDEAE